MDNESSPAAAAADETKMEISTDPMEETAPKATTEAPASQSDKAASEKAPTGEEATVQNDIPKADEAAPQGEAPKNDEKSDPAPEIPDWKERYARAMADFDNFRKRTLRDREDLVKSAAAGVIKDVLPTVDNLARALEKANAEDPFVTGVKLVYDGLLKTLANHGATPLDSVGEPFDANFHEALAQMPSPDVAEGVIMNEVKRGWLLNGKLLRAAQVVVSAGQPNA